MDHLGHPEDALVELDPVLHAAELDVADDVIEREQADTRVGGRLARDVPRQVRAFVRVAIDERVHDVAVGRDRREHDLAVLVLDRLRLHDPARAALNRLPVRLVRVRDAQRDVLHTVAVQTREVADLVAAPQRARDDEADLVLLEDVARAIAHTGLRPRVRGAPEAERVLVVVRRLLRVPDPQLDVVPPVEGHEIFAHVDDSRAAPAGVPAAASTAATSSSDRRSVCSFTKSTAMTQAAAADARRDEERRMDRAGEPAAKRRRQPVHLRRLAAGRDARAAARGSRARP